MPRNTTARPSAASADSRSCPSIERGNPGQPAPKPPLPVAAGVRGHRVEPAACVGERAAGFDVRDEAEEGVLHDVLRLIRVVEHRERQPVEAGRVPVEQPGDDPLGRARHLDHR